jgi:hypothetical protein
MKKEEMFGGTREKKKAQEEAQRLDYRELQKEVDQLDKDIDQLRATYELFFMGVEKAEPTSARDVAKATLRRWKEMPIKNTAIKFQVGQLKARMVALENYWGRIMRQREDGTYGRDLARVKRREAELAAQQARLKQAKDKNGKLNPASPVTGEITPTQLAGGQGQDPEGRAITGKDLRDGKSNAVTAGRGAQGKSSPSTQDLARPSATSADDLTEPKLRKLYQTYIGARKRCGEPVDLRYEEMAAALRKQVPKLIQTTGAKAVEFKVVIRGGRAVLKALPKH